MLRTLLESARPHSIPLGSLAASIAVHAALSIPVWNGPGADTVAERPESFITRALFLPPPDRILSRAAGSERLSWASLGSVGSDAFMADAPVASALGGAVLSGLRDVQPEPIESDESRNGVGAGNDTAYSILAVDQAVVRFADSGAPLYPADLLQRSVEGSVRMRYVVNATGRVDTSSARVLRSSHPQFTAAVLDALGRMRFQPASIATLPVSQVVEQSFDFRIDRPQADTLALPPAAW